MQIDIVFDTICPWCFIGKRRLEDALRKSPQPDIELTWHPFLLNPEMPVEGIDKDTYFNAKFGGDRRSQRVYDAIGEAGRTVAIDFDFDRMERIPSTIDSHRLVKFADRKGLGEAAVEALFLAYFIDGKDTGERSVLIDIGEDLGLEADRIGHYLDGDADVSVIQDQNAQAHRNGVSGVPAYIIDGQFAVSGAQEPEIFLRMFDIANAKRAMDLDSQAQSVE